MHYTNAFKSLEFSSILLISKNTIMIVLPFKIRERIILIFLLYMFKSFKNTNTAANVLNLGIVVYYRIYILVTNLTVYFLNS